MAAVVRAFPRIPTLALAVERRRHERRVGAMHSANLRHSHADRRAGTPRAGRAFERCSGREATKRRGSLSWWRRCVKDLRGVPERLLAFLEGALRYPSFVYPRSRQLARRLNVLPSTAHAPLLPRAGCRRPSDTSPSRGLIRAARLFRESRTPVSDVANHLGLLIAAELRPATCARCFTSRPENSAAPTTVIACSNDSRASSSCRT